MAFLESFSKNADAAEHMKPERQNDKEIKPETGMTEKEVKDFWKNLFRDMENKEAAKEEVLEKELEKAVEDYMKELEDKTEFPDTLPDKLFEASDLKKLSPEENKKMRDEFNGMREKLIRQWEGKNGCAWPTYETDVSVINKEGKLVILRHAGKKYDVHHIHPLGLGGKNEVDNITPLKVEAHNEVHRAGGPYKTIENLLGGN